MPEPLVRDLIGHESELVSREYTHMDEKTERKAILKLPVLKLGPHPNEEGEPSSSHLPAGGVQHPACWQVCAGAREDTYAVAATA